MSYDKRIEIKCKLTKKQYKFIHNYLKNSDIFFVNNYPSRNIKSIYYDNKFLKNYYNHVYGIQDRLKVRLRIYNSDFNLSKYFNYEIKYKNNIYGNKLIKRTSIRTLPNFFNTLKPLLMVNYDREYYLFKNNLRITLDNNLEFTKVSLSDNKFKYYNKIKTNFAILEFKFAAKRNEEVINNINKIIKNNFLFIEKYSKYIDGVEKLRIVN